MMDYGNTTERNAALRGIPIKVCGVYKITNKLDGKFYIGSAADIRYRLRHHLFDLRKNQHVSPHLQRAFNRDGEASFKFEIVELCDPSTQFAREQHYLDALTPFDDKIGYNISRRADSGPVYEWTPEMRAATSQRFRGVAKSAEHRRKIGDAQKWRTHSSEMRQLLSSKTSEYFADPDKRDAHSARLKGRKRRGVPHTLEARQKMSAERMGKGAGCHQKYTIIHGYEWSRMRNMGLTLREIAYFMPGVHVAQISKAIRKYEQVQREAA